MTDRIVSRGFTGRPRAADALASRTPPGQYLTTDFPVLSAGPTPHPRLETWDLTVQAVDGTSRRWSWDDYRALPAEPLTCDIHCVTKWSKLDTRWLGVPLDLLLDGLTEHARFVVAHCDGGYTTNLPLADVLGNRAWVTSTYDDKPLAPEHGGPARLLVPHLYFWKSAKWLRRLVLLPEDQPSFWESLGYHNYGDPWREQRYWGD